MSKKVADFAELSRVPWWRCASALCPFLVSDVAVTETMRRDQLYLVGLLASAAWMLMTYFLFANRPESVKERRKVDESTLSPFLAQLSARVEAFGQKLQHFAEDNEQLLREVDLLRETRVQQKSESLNQVEEPRADPQPPSEVVIPILMFACNRPTVRKALDPLLEYRGQDPARIKKFPIIVSQVRNYA